MYNYEFGETQDGTERRHIRVTGIHSGAYQWLMTCIKGLEMPKIVNEPLSPSISETARANFARVVLDEPLMIVGRNDIRDSSEEQSQFLSSCRPDKARFMILPTNRKCKCLENARKTIASRNCRCLNIGRRKVFHGVIIYKRLSIKGEATENMPL